MSRELETTETSLRILSLLHELDGATMAELSDELGLAKSTVHGHLSTLETHRLVTKEGHEYVLGLRFYEFGEYTKQRRPEVEPASELVHRLASETGEGANFCIGEHGRISILCGEIPTSDDPAYNVGNSFYMHNTAVGKAMLAEMDDGAVADVLDRWGMPAATEETITSRDVLFEELDTIREQGYALNKEELYPGLQSVAMTAQAPDSSVVGAFSVGGPTYRVSQEKLRQEFAGVIREVKSEFERRLKSVYDPTETIVGGTEPM